MCVVWELEPKKKKNKGGGGDIMLKMSIFQSLAILEVHFLVPPCKASKKKRVVGGGTAYQLWAIF